MTPEQARRRPGCRGRSGSRRAFVLGSLCATTLLGGWTLAGRNSGFGRSPPGIFPRVSGNDLSGRQYRLPERFGKDPRPVLVLFGWRHRNEAASWSQLQEEMAATRPGHESFVVYLFPRTSDFQRHIVNATLRNLIADRETRRRTFTVFTDPDAFATTTGLDPRASHTLLVDGSGAMSRQATGAGDASAGTALRGRLAPDPTGRGRN